MDKRRIAMLSAVCVAVLKMLGLTTRQRLKECEARLKECDAQRDGAIHERNELRRQIDEQVAGTNDATSLQLKLRRALQERDHFARVYEAARIERDTVADQNRTLKIERDRYREERDQAYGWVNQSVREINELRAK
jgi:hypothetical protein